jgi:hypothetical protein
MIYVIERREGGTPPAPGSEEHFLTCALLRRLFGQWPSMS